MEKESATIYLICGFVGAGKTTFARQLEAEHQSVRFSIDEWMTRLFGAAMTREDFDAREALCKELIWTVACRLIELRIDVVLDYGFWKKSERLRYAEMSRQVGATPRLYYLPCSVEDVRRRLRLRNTNLPFGHLMITDAMVDTFLPRFEPPSADEEFEEVLW